MELKNFRGTFANWNSVPDINQESGYKSVDGSKIPQIGDYIIVRDAKNYPYKIVVGQESMPTTVLINGISKPNDDLIGRVLAQDINYVDPPIPAGSLINCEDCMRIGRVSDNILLYTSLSWKFVLEKSWEAPVFDPTRTYFVNEIVLYGGSYMRYTGMERNPWEKIDYTPGKSQWIPYEEADDTSFSSFSTAAYETQVLSNTKGLQRALENLSNIFWGSMNLTDSAISQIEALLEEDDEHNRYNARNLDSLSCHEGDTLWINVTNTDTGVFGQLYLTALQDATASDETVITRVRSFVWSGLDGAVWFSGEGSPNDNPPSGAKDGDMYLDTSNGFVYSRSNGVWAKKSEMRGKDGASFSHIEEFYLAHNSDTGVTYDTPHWNDKGTDPDDPDNPEHIDYTEICFDRPYLWNYEKIYKVNNGVTTHETTTPKVVGTYGGKGISEIDDYYILTDSELHKPAKTDNGWSKNNPPTITSFLKCLWNYTKITYTDNSTSESEITAIGRFGDEGKSAFDIAVEEGYVGSKSQWISSLHGSDGDKWYNGENAPSSTIGTEGDWYLNTENGDFYNRFGVETYATISAIPEPPDFHTLYLVEDVNNKYYRYVEDDSVAGYHRIDLDRTPGASVNPWVYDGNITGADGDKWFSGNGIPSDNEHESREGYYYVAGTKQGDYYLNVANGDVYHKGVSGWGSSVGNIKGPRGGSGSNGISDYIFIVYSPNPNAQPVVMHDAEHRTSDDVWMGVAIVSVEASTPAVYPDPPTNPASYEWSKVVGDDAGKLRIRGEWYPNTPYFNGYDAGDPGDDTVNPPIPPREAGDFIDVVYVDDPVYTKGTYACTSSHTSGSIFIPTNWTLMAADGEKGENGDDSIFLVLSNENCSVPSKSDGTDPILTANTSTTATLYKGGDVVSATYRVSSKSSGITLSQSSNTFTVQTLDGDTEYADIEATLSSDNTKKYVKRFIVTKMKQGIDGKNATTYWIDKSTTIIKKEVNSNPVGFDPSNVVFTAMKQVGSEAPTEFTTGYLVLWKNGDSIEDDDGTGTLTVTAANGDSYYTVKLYEDSESDPETDLALDTETVHIVECGKNPVLSATKSGKTTTITADGNVLASIQDGDDGEPSTSYPEYALTYAGVAPGDDVWQSEIPSGWKMGYSYWTRTRYVYSPTHIEYSEAVEDTAYNQFMMSQVYLRIDTDRTSYNKDLRSNKLFTIILNASMYGYENPTFSWVIDTGSSQTSYTGYSVNLSYEQIRVPDRFVVTCSLSSTVNGITYTNTTSTTIDVNDITIYDVNHGVQESALTSSTGKYVNGDSYALHTTTGGVDNYLPYVYTSGQWIEVNESVISKYPSQMAQIRNSILAKGINIPTSSQAIYAYFRYASIQHAQIDAVATSSITLQNPGEIKSSNYTEDSYGNPIAGFKIDSAGNSTFVTSNVVNANVSGSFTSNPLETQDRTEGQEITASWDSTAYYNDGDVFDNILSNAGSNQLVSVSGTYDSQTISYLIAQNETQRSEAKTLAVNNSITQSASISGAVPVDCSNVIITGTPLIKSINTVAYTGSNVARMQFSLDGSTWNDFDSERIVSRNNGQSVYARQVYTPMSIDYINPLSYTRGSGVKASAIAYGNGYFIAVGSANGINTDGLVWKSTDGLSWTQTYNKGEGGFMDITFGNGRFVATAANAGGVTTAILTSDDGVTWTTRKTDSGTLVLKYVCFGGGKFKTAAYSGWYTHNQSYESTDGITWTQNGNAAGDITYGAGKFVCMEPRNINWRGGGDGNTSGFITYANGQFIKTTTGGAQNAWLIYTSTDGSSWNVVYSGVSSSVYASYGNVVFADNYYFMSFNGAVHYSTDLIHWNDSVGTNLNLLYVDDIGIVGITSSDFYKWAEDTYTENDWTVATEGKLQITYDYTSYPAGANLMDSNKTIISTISTSHNDWRTQKTTIPSYSLDPTPHYTFSQFTQNSSALGSFDAREYNTGSSFSINFTTYDGTSLNLTSSKVTISGRDYYYNVKWNGFTLQIYLDGQSVGSFDTTDYFRGTKSFSISPVGTQDAILVKSVLPKADKGGSDYWSIGDAGREFSAGYFDNIYGIHHGAVDGNVTGDVTGSVNATGSGARIDGPTYGTHHGSVDASGSGESITGNLTGNASTATEWASNANIRISDGTHTGDYTSINAGQSVTVRLPTKIYGAVWN